MQRISFQSNQKNIKSKSKIKSSRQINVKFDIQLTLSTGVVRKNSKNSRIVIERSNKTVLTIVKHIKRQSEAQNTRR